MKKRIIRLVVACSCWLTPISQLNAQLPEDWTTPFPGHRIIGNLYGVGTSGLSVFLITSEEGHILVNSGLKNSTPIVQNNIESLGFRIEDVKILLTMQAHFDHAAALGSIKQITGAKMWATAADARLLEDGGVSDPLFGGEQLFEPVAVDKIILDGEVIELGEIRLRVHEHPGHTIGSSSYSMQIQESGRNYDVAIANMGSINGGTKFVLDPTYPGIAEDFAKTFQRQKAMDVDIWVAAHAGQYRFHTKYSTGQAYDPDTFVDPSGFYAEVDRLEKIYLKLLAEERLLEGNN